MSDFAVFARGSTCSTFIYSVRLIEIAMATSTVEMALSVLMDRRKEWEDTFVKKFGVPVDSEVGLPKMIGAFCVMAHCSLNVEGVGFVKSAPPPAPALELQELKKLVEDQRMAMEGLRKELAEVSAKSQAAAKRKMVGVPPLSKAELLKVRELDAKPQWVYASLLALSTLLWRRDVPTHGGRHTVELFACFGVRACVPSFCAKPPHLGKPPRRPKSPPYTPSRPPTRTTPCPLPPPPPSTGGTPAPDPLHRLPPPPPPPSLEIGWKVPDHGRRRRPKKFCLT